MVTSEHAVQIDNRWAPLGSIEHIVHIAEASKSFRARKLSKFYDFLMEHQVAESIAYFIAQNETPKRGTSERHRSLDTRDLHGYQTGPIVDAEFHYDPVQDERYVFLAGRRWPKSQRHYSMKMFMRDDLELDTSRPPEAYVAGGIYPVKTFRTFAYPEYKEDRPAVFLNVLRTATNGLEQFVATRDNS